jgi:hypothetical protein
VFEFNRATGQRSSGAVFAATAQRQQDAHLHEIGRTMKRAATPGSGANCARSTATAI